MNDNGTFKMRLTGRDRTRWNFRKRCAGSYVCEYSARDEDVGTRQAYLRT